MKHTRREIEQILNLFVVYLSETGLDEIGTLALLDLAPQFLDGSRDDPFALILLIYLSLENLLLSRHRVGFTRSCLSIREHCCTITLDSSVYQFFHIATLIAFLLVISRYQYFVELIALLRASAWWKEYFCDILSVLSFSALRQAASLRESSL